MTDLSEFGKYEVLVAEEDGHISETWTREGVVHRIGNPAIIHYDSETRTEIYKAYVVNGLVHRKDKPAIEHIDAQSGVVFLQEYYEKGLLHRSGNMAARIKLNPKTGNLRGVDHYEHGECLNPSSVADFEP